MTLRNLFPWLVFILGILISKFVIYIPLLNAIVTVSFAIGIADLFVWVVAPHCHDQLHKFINGTIVELGITVSQHRRSEYSEHAAIGGVMWFLIFVAILVTRYAI